MIFIIVSVILSLDQLSKFIVTSNVAYFHPVPVIKNFFYISIVHNRGAAFGILKDQTPLFIFTSVLAIILIILNLRGGKNRKSYNIFLSLILAGAMGNLIDRVFFGYVIDFLDFRIWPVFNVADSAITIGAVLLAWNILFDKKHVSDNL